VVLYGLLSLLEEFSERHSNWPWGSASGTVDNVVFWGCVAVSLIVAGAFLFGWWRNK